MKRFNVKELLWTLIVAALLSSLLWLAIAFVWMNVGNFTHEAQINIAVINGICFGLIVGYRLKTLVKKK